MPSIEANNLFRYDNIVIFIDNEIVACYPSIIYTTSEVTMVQNHKFGHEI